MPEWILPLALGGTLHIDRPLVMGILNATPDSFSDGGQLATPDAVARAIRAMAESGADLLDVGGESTRPGHTGVPVAEELRRVLPVLAACRHLAPGIPVSIDTSKAVVARTAIAAGASFVNDVSGLRDPTMAAVVREAGCAVVLMRSQPLHGELVTSCRDELGRLLARAAAEGIDRDATVLDPGLGFGDPPGASVAANQALLRGVARYAHGRPVLVGASRKRFIGALMSEPEPSRRVAGSVAAVIEAVRAGASIVRVHDVAETVAALRALREA